MGARVGSEWGSTATTMASSQTFYFLLVPLFVLWLIYFKLSRRNLNKHAANIPGPPGYPIIGNLFDLMGSSHSKYKSFSFFLNFCFFFFFHVLDSATMLSKTEFPKDKKKRSANSFPSVKVLRPFRIQ